MPRFSNLFRSLRRLCRKDRVEEEMVQELRFHVDCEIEKNIAAGMGAEEARYAALRRFGGVEQIKDMCRDACHINWIESLWRDFCQGLRILRSSPALSLTIILTLALGIGANSGIFSLANTLLFRGLPFREPDRLVAIWNESQNGDRLTASGADIADWSSQSGVFEGIAGYLHNPNGAFATELSEGEEPEHLYNIEVTDGFFSVLGVQPILGRSFSAEDYKFRGRMVFPAILTYDMWQTRFGGRTDVLGQVFSIGTNRLVVVGVMPRDFRLFRPFTVVGVVGDVRQHGMRRSPPKRQMYVPLFFSGFARDDMHYVILRTRGDPANAVAMVRDVLQELDPGRSLKLARTMKQVVANNTAWDRLNSAVVTLFGLLAVLLTLIGIYGVVTRAVSLRTKEIGIRVALGSRPRDVVWLIVKQGMRMALLGLPAGLTAAWLGARLLSSQLFGVSPADIRIYAGVTLLLLIVTLAASYLPALRATKVTPVIALRCD